MQIPNLSILQKTIIKKLFDGWTIYTDHDINTSKIYRAYNRAYTGTKFVSITVNPKIIKHLIDINLLTITTNKLIKNAMGTNYRIYLTLSPEPCKNSQINKQE